MRRLLLSVLVLTLLSAIQPTMAQTSKDEAKLLKRFENYFTKYKPKGTRLTQQPRMVDCQIDRATKTLTITADEFFAAQEFTPEITASIYKKLKGELTKPFKGYRITVVTNGMTIEERIKAAKDGDQDAMESLANSYLNGDETEQQHPDDGKAEVPGFFSDSAGNRMEHSAAGRSFDPDHGEQRCVWLHL